MARLPATARAIFRPPVRLERAVGEQPVEAHGDAVAGDVNMTTAMTTSRQPNQPPHAIGMAASDGQERKRDERPPSDDAFLRRLLIGAQRPQRYLRSAPAPALAPAGWRCR